MAARNTALPIADEQKSRCPFYGFSGLSGVFIDSCGNQCALIVDSHSPCYMKVGGDKPDWDKCRYNTTEVQDSMRQNSGAQVFSNAAGERGTTLSQHYEQVMGRKL